MRRYVIPFFAILIMACSLTSNLMPTSEYGTNSGQVELTNTPKLANSTLTIPPTKEPLPTNTSDSSQKVDPDLNASPTATKEPIKQSGISSGFEVISYKNRTDLESFKTFKMSGAINTIAFSADENLLAAGGDNKKIFIWNIKNGKEINQLHVPVTIRDLAFSEDGKWLASTGLEKKVYVWDTSSWELVKTLDLISNGVAVRFLPDGVLMTAEFYPIVKKWDIETGSLISEEKIPSCWSGQSQWNNATLISFDTNETGDLYAASTCGFGVIWDEGTGKNVLISEIGHTNLMPTTAELPDGADVLFRTLRSRISLSKDGNLAVFGSTYYWQRGMLAMDIIEVTSNQVLASVNPVDLEPMGLEIGVNNDIFFAGVEKNINVWWPQSYRWDGGNYLSLRTSAKVTSLKLSDSGKLLASGNYDGNLQLWGVRGN